MKQINTLLAKGKGDKHQNFYLTLHKGKDVPDEEIAYRIKGSLGCPRSIRFKTKDKQEALTKYDEIVKKFVTENWEDHTPSFYK